MTEPDRDALAAQVLERAVAVAPRVPVATYRVQFNREFTFRDAVARTPYLHALGISDLYASPYLRARPESSHGYDVVDHSTLNPAIGSRADYDAMVETLHRHGMGQVLDVVPNHMGVGSDNPWWMDVLENGPAAVRAEAFDIDWHPLKRELDGKLLLPVLGDQYGAVLERGELRLVFEAGAFFIAYWEHRWPVDPSTYGELLSLRLDDLIARLGPEHFAVLELQSIITAVHNLPSRIETAPQRIAERAREKEIIKRRLAAVVEAAPAVRTAIEETVAAYTGTPGDPRSFNRLDALLDRQPYRLSFWRVAAEEINYRRFFDINDLAAIRVERPAIFRDSHRLILDLLGVGAVTGVRVDHIDGLWDPRAYTRRLQAAYAVRTGAGAMGEDGTAGAGVEGIGGEALEEAIAARLGAGRNHRPPTGDAYHPSAPLWVVVEKILGTGERLPRDWPVSGTTGYDFLNLVNGLFVDSARRDALDDIYTRFTGLRASFREVAYACKLLIMTNEMPSELNALGRALSRLAGRNRRTRDFTLNSLTDALREVIVCFPVYRTYLTEDDEPPSEQDRARIETAILRARRRNPAVDPSVFDFVRDTLLLTPIEGEDEYAAAERRAFVMKFQQYTGPVAAKGVEDTAFYRYNRLVSLNEVGGEPDQFGVSVAAFHQANADRLRDWPDAMITTATHDTKRGEDVRARINVLSELPGNWRTAVFRWSRANAMRKTRVDDALAPDANEEYLLYQILLGAWPAEPMDAAARADFIARVQRYMLKAAKEAKVNTSWINPNEPYDRAVQDFVAAILSGDDNDPFLRDFLPFQRRVARVGMVNSLAQLTLKLAAPGIPDIYQGTECWDLNLVDPDNRRPVDYDRRATALAEFAAIDDADPAPDAGASTPPAEATCAGRRARLAEELLAAWTDGRIKLYVMQRGLTLRRERAALFRRGAYVPLTIEGHARAHAVAFARVDGDAGVIAVVPRLVARLGADGDGLPLGEGVWRNTCLVLPDDFALARLRDRFTGVVLSPRVQDGRSVLPLAAVFARFPVALLVREP